MDLVPVVIFLGGAKKQQKKALVTHSLHRLVLTLTQSHSLPHASPSLSPSPSHAPHAGEENESRLLGRRLRSAIENYGQLLIASRNLSFFTSFYRYLIQVCVVCVGGGGGEEEVVYLYRGITPTPTPTP